MGIVWGYTTPRIRWLYRSCGVGDGGAVGVHGRDLVGAEAVSLRIFMVCSPR